MVKSIIYTVLLSILHHATIAKNLPGYRKHRWEQAGNTEQQVSGKEVTITEFGGDAYGKISNNSALLAAMASLGAEGGTVRFVGGDYLFKETIELPSNVVLQGNGNTTTLRFALGKNEDAILLKGSSAITEITLTESSSIGETTLVMSSTSGLKPGALLRIGYKNSQLATSEWARNSIAQIVKVTSVDGNRVHVESPMRLALDINQELLVSAITPVRNSGVACMEIVREDATTEQTSNIKLMMTENCFVKNVISQYANFAHVEIFESTKAEVSGSYFRYAHAYGGGGQGYGVMIHLSSGECLVENNIFEHPPTFNHSASRGQWQRDSLQLFCRPLLGRHRTTI